MVNIPHAKECRKCGTIKLSSEFYRDSHSSDGLNSFCKECNKAYSRAYAKAHYDPTKKKPWIKRPITEKRREQLRESSRKWAKNNPTKRAITRHQRRALLFGNSGSYTAEEWAALCDWFGNVCLACGKPEVTVDHVVPVTKRGTNNIENLQPLCRACNAAKKNKTIDYRDPDLLEAFFRGHYG